MAWRKDLHTAPSTGFIGYLVCDEGGPARTVAPIEDGDNGWTIAGHSPDVLAHDGWKLAMWQPYPTPPKEPGQ